MTTSFLYIESSKGADVLSWCGGFGWSDRLDDSSKSRDTVLDPFGGSGSTLIACDKAGRQARLIELDPKYVDVIVRRWQEFSGGTATLEGDGCSFEEVAAQGPLDSRAAGRHGPADGPEQSQNNHDPDARRSGREPEALGDL